MKRSVVLAALLSLVVAPALDAHDLFLKLTSYFVTPGVRPVRVSVLNGTFARSENAVSRDRVRDLALVGLGGVVHLGLPAWSTSGDTSYLTFPVRQAGTYVLGASTRPSMISLSGTEFNEYLREDGITDVLDARARRGELDRPARERYSKHVKAVFQAGEPRTQTYGAVLGYPAEIVPLVNPYTLRVGDSLAVRCLVDGKPVANQIVLAGGEPPAPPTVVTRPSRADSTDSAAAGGAAAGAAGAMDSAGAVAVADSGVADSSVTDSAAARRPKLPPAGVVRSAGSTGGGRVISVSAGQAGQAMLQQTVRTDADGVARIALGQSGKWYVKFVHMTPVVGDPALDYESKWATLTFEIR